jgi:hypothetical protein
MRVCLMDRFLPWGALELVRRNVPSHLSRVVPLHTRQNSSAPENSFPQLGQVRLSSVFMGLTVLQPQAASGSTGPRRPLENHTPVPQTIPCFIDNSG